MDDVKPPIVTLLEEMTAGFDPPYMRWLENAAGDNNDPDYCTKCVEIQRYVERHKRTGFTRISGWNEAFEQDGPRFCERCGVGLNIWPTRYHATESLGCCADWPEIDQYDAFLLLLIIHDHEEEAIPVLGLMEPVWRAAWMKQKVGVITKLFRVAAEIEAETPITVGATVQQKVGE